MALPWTCSICALRCDDVQIEQQAGGVMLSPPCGLASQVLEKLAGAAPRTPLLLGKSVSWAEALDAAADAIVAAGAVTLCGVCPDFQTARAAIALAESTAANIVTDATPMLRGLSQAIARDGVTSATLGDVRQHADRILYIGSPEASMPRLVSRFAHDVPSLIVLPAGQAARPAPNAEAPSAECLTLDNSLTQWLRNVLLQMQHIETPTLPTSGPAPANVTRVLQFLEGGRYVAIIVAADFIPPVNTDVINEPAEDAQQAASWLLRWSERLGQHTRCVLLAPDPAATVRQTLLWRTGFVSPMRFRQQTPDGFPLIDPADTILRLQPSSSAPPSASRPAGRTILLGDDATTDGDADAADVFLPVGWPGIDCAGTTVRGDGSVTLALRPLPASLGLNPRKLSAAAALKQLMDACLEREMV